MPAARVPIGIATFAFMGRRALLRIFSACYAFVRRNYGHRFKVWRSVARECGAPATLLPFAGASMRLPVHPMTMMRAFLTDFHQGRCESTRPKMG